MDSVSKIALGFIVGVAFGTLLGVLTAPHKGTITRRKIVRAGTDIVDDLKDKLDDSVDEMKGLYKSTKKEAEDLVGKIKK